MELRKLKYVDESGTEQRYVSQKMEFFIHYWKYLFSSSDLQLDKHYLKSHRTVIQKLRLQIDGNFDHSKKYFKLFLIDEELFKNRNSIIKAISNTAEKKTINKIKKLYHSNSSVKNWGSSADKPKNKKNLLRYITKLETWLSCNYPSTLSENLISELEKDTVVDPKSINTIKELTNCLIIELFNKGFNPNFITQVPDILFDKDRFPYTRSALDFDSTEEYDLYKTTEWESLSLKTQIEGIINLINMTLKSRKAVFRVYDINWRHEPVSLYGVEFYNPNIGFNPKCNPEAKFKIFEETFTSKPEEYEKNSTCNAIVEIEGIQEGQIRNLGYKKVRLALSIMNRELDLHGKVYRNNSFTTNLSFDRIWGSFKALTRGYKALDEVNPDQLDRLDHVRKLNIDDNEDKIVITLISQISEVFKDHNSYYAERTWMILEATFGTFDQISELFKSIMKIYIKRNFIPILRQRLIEMVDPISKLPDVDNDFLKKFYLERKYGSYQIEKFVQNLSALKSETEIILIQDLVGNILEFNTNKNQFFQNIDSYIEYFLNELYMHRNLTVHRNMSDDLFLLKQQQFEYYSTMWIEFFLFEYLKPHRTRTIKSTVKRLIRKANSI